MSFVTGLLSRNENTEWQGKMHEMKEFTAKFEAEDKSTRLFDAQLVRIA